MEIKLPSETIFYQIENTIKAYRKFAQKNITSEISNLTIDQSLALLYLSKFPDLAQHELARLLFKDNASLTRIIDNMVKKGFLQRSINERDRRTYKLAITTLGQEAVDKLPGIIGNNRAAALEGVTQAEIEQLENILNKIKYNCK